MVRNTPKACFEHTGAFFHKLRNMPKACFAFLQKLLRKQEKIILKDPLCQIIETILTHKGENADAI